MKASGLKSRFSRGRWELERERAQLEDRRPPAPIRDPRAIAEVIPALMKRLGAEAPHWVRLLQDEWPGLVGAAVAAHTRPGRLDRESLIVFVDSSVWLYELERCGRQTMLSKLRERFPGLPARSITMQLDPDGPQKR